MNHLRRKPSSKSEQLSEHVSLGGITDGCVGAGARLAISNPVPGPRKHDGDVDTLFLLYLRIVKELYVGFWSVNS